MAVSCGRRYVEFTLIKIETKRLVLREVTPDDAAFFLALLTDPDWIRNIGDRNVHSLDDAVAYMHKAYIPQYAKHGFGLYLAARKDGTPIGMCGLIKRDTLDDVDIGFAFLPAYRGQGYALEAARATLQYGRDVLNKNRMVAITLPDNLPSVALLEKIGMKFARKIRLGDDPDELALYAIELQA